MSIVMSVHEPWHYRNWEPVLRHMRPDEVQIHVSPWRWHLPDDPNVRQERLDATVSWLNERGVDVITQAPAIDPHVWATLGIDDREVPERYSMQVRMLYAVISKQYTYSDLNRTYDCVMVASSFGRELLARHQVRAEVVGYPKLDDVFNGVITRETARRQLAIDPEATVVLYAPTLGDQCSAPRFSAVLADLPAEIELLVQLHPVSYLRERDRFLQLEERARFVDPVDASLETLLATDVVVTDYSGVIFEACAADVPVILLDDPQLPETDDVERAYRDAGPRVADPSALRAALEEVLADPSRHSERRAHYRDRFFEYHGRAGERAADALRGMQEEARRHRARDADLIYARMRALERVAGV